MHTYLHGAVAPISGVLGGEFDLRVPVLMAVIDSVNKLSQGDVAVELMVCARKTMFGSRCEARLFSCAGLGFIWLRDV